MTATELVLASGNPAKLRELRDLLAPLGLRLIGQTDLGIDSVEETATTFVENALLKARHAAAASGLPAIADDSGIAVRALGGAPGVNSARYAGDMTSDADNNARLLAELAAADGGRKASYHCVLVLLRHPRDPVPIVTWGRWDGAILQRPRGVGGFGYDPLFYDARFGMTAAEMPAELKNALSHRGHAVRALIDRLRAEPLA